MKNQNKNIVSGYDPKKVNLSTEEQAFEDQMDVTVYRERSPKSERTNIRLPEDDLILLRGLAAKYGIPYQTLIGSVIHRFVTNQLVDIDEAKKILELERDKKRA